MRRTFNGSTAWLTVQLTRLRGFQDTLGAQARSLAAVEDCSRKVAERHNVGEIRIPVLERLELFQHSSGEPSDVGEKQMSSFRDRDEGDTTLLLMPASTP